MSGPDLLPSEEGLPERQETPAKPNPSGTPPRPTRKPDPAKGEKREQLNKVQDALDGGKLKDAIKELEKHIELHPDDVDARLRLANLFVKKGKSEEAWEWLVNAASGFAKRGFLDKAIALLHRAYELDPDKPETVMVAAEYQVKRGHAGDARKSLKVARGRYKRKRDLERAMLVAQKRAQLVPDVDAWLDVATLFVRTGDANRAVLILDEQTARTDVKKDRRRYLRARLWLNPTPRSLWRWLRG